MHRIIVDPIRGPVILILCEFCRDILGELKGETPFHDLEILCLECAAKRSMGESCRTK